MSNAPLPVPFRLRVLRALTAALEPVAFGDERGKTYEMGGKVFRGRVVFGDTDPLPMISILESPMQDAGSMAGRQGTMTKQPWELVIQGFVKDDNKNPTDPAHFLLAEVKKTLVKERARTDLVTRQIDILGFKGRVESLTFDPGVVRPPDEVSSVAHFWLTLYLGVVEDLSKPYE